MLVHNYTIAYVVPASIMFAWGPCSYIWHIMSGRCRKSPVEKEQVGNGYSISRLQKSYPHLYCVCCRQVLG